MITKKLLTLATAAVGLAFAQSASAADMAVKAPPVVVPPPVATWTGCYIGGHIGYGWSRATDNNLPYAVSHGFGPAPDGAPIVFGYDGKYSPSGVTGGIQGGCDKQFGQAVFGVVIDYSWTDQKKNSPGFQIQPFFDPTSSGPEVGQVNLKSYGTARGRLGYLFSPNLLFYGTGGVAFARASFGVGGSVICGGGCSGVFAVSDTANFVGWAAGLGGEWRFAPNWTFGVEYLHLDFGNANFRLAAPVFPNGTSADALVAGTNVKLTSDVVRATVNYRF